jgi:hypothetical protein
MAKKTVLAIGIERGSSRELSAQAVRHEQTADDLLPRRPELLRFSAPGSSSATSQIIASTMRLCNSLGTGLL